MYYSLNSYHKVWLKDKEEGYSCHVAALPKRMLNSLPRRRMKPKIPGVVIAKVEGFRDSYALIDKAGRYTVHMPFDEENQEFGGSTPIHLAQPYAVEGGGTHFPLRRGTPLLVAFEDGDIDKPIAVGALPIGLHKGPVGSENSFQNIIKTSSGISLVFDDNAGSLDIEAPDNISFRSGSRLDLESDDISIEGKDKIVFKTENGLQITLDDSTGVLTVESPGDIVLDSGGNIVFDAKSVAIGDGTVAAAVPAATNNAAGAGGSELAFQGTGAGLDVAGRLAAEPRAVQQQGIATSGSQASQGAGASTASTGKLLVRGVIGEKKEAAPGEKVMYWVSEYSRSDGDVSSQERLGIKWAVKVDGGINVLKGKTGDRVSLEMKKEWIGKEISVMACFEGFNEKVCYKTRVKRFLIKNVEGKNEASPGDVVLYKVTNYSMDEEIFSTKARELSTYEKNCIRWAVKVNEGINVLKDKNGEETHGDTISIKIESKWVGEIVLVMACIEGFNKDICQKTAVRKAGVKPKVTEMYWMDSNEKNRIGTIKKGQTAVLYVKTKNFNPGEIVTVSFVNDKTSNEFTLSGTVDAQGLAKIQWKYGQLI